MNVADIMTENPITVLVDQTLGDALLLMETHQIKHLPVLSRHRHLVGIVSDRDCRLALNSPFIERAYWQENALETVDVRSVMTPAPIIVESSDSAMEATRLMLANQVGCLPVMRAETLIGIVTRTDLLVAFMNLHRYYQNMLR